MSNNLCKMRDSKGSKALTDMVYAFNRAGLTWLEEGSFAGESAGIVLSTGRIDRIYCVDPWSNGYDSADIASKQAEDAEKVFDETVGKDPRVVKLKGYAADVCKDIDTVDVVYIDSCHQYEAVKRSLLFYRNNLCPKLAFSGHDYSSYWPGVQRAVREVLGWPIHVFPDSSWIVPTTMVKMPLTPLAEV